jgi:hypothetical protein
MGGAEREDCVARRVPLRAEATMLVFLSMKSFRVPGESGGVAAHCLSTPHAMSGTATAQGSPHPRFAFASAFPEKLAAFPGSQPEQPHRARARTLHKCSSRQAEVAMTMVVQMFDTLTAAQRAVSELVDSGCARNTISILVRDALAHTPDMRDAGQHGPLAQATNIIAGGPLGEALHRTTENVGPRAVIQCLKTAGLKPSAADFFADAICQGAILVAVHCSDGDVRSAREILDTHRSAGTAWKSSARSH